MPSGFQRIMQSGKGTRAKRLVVCVLHVVLWPILLIPRMFWPRRSLQAVPDSPRILLIRIDGIGDLTMSATIFPALRRRFPGGTVDLLTSEVATPIGQMLLDAKWIDSLFTMPLLHRTLRDHLRMAKVLRRRKYDVAIDLRSDVRNVILIWLSGAPIRLGLAGSGLDYLLTDSIDLPVPHHQVDEPVALVRRLGVTELDRWPTLPLRDEDIAAADRWLAEHDVKDDRPICAFHLRAFLPSKVWPLERFIEVARRLRSDLDAQLLVIGGKSEIDLANEFVKQLGGTVAVATGQAPLPLTAAILSRASILVGNDSGPAHVAAAVGCPVVVLFGNGNPSHFGVRSPDAILMQSPHPCSAGCGKECARPATRCMLDLSVDMVTDAAKSLVSRLSRSQRVQ
jgi:lipopolysaccharide heptosyltransferase II